MNQQKRKQRKQRKLEKYLRNLPKVLHVVVIKKGLVYYGYGLELAITITTLVWEDIFDLLEEEVLKVKTTRISSVVRRGASKNLRLKWEDPEAIRIIIPIH